MKVLWTLAKLVIAVAVAVPVSIVVLTVALGILGTVVGLAVLALRLAVLGLIAWGVFRLISAVFRGGIAPRKPSEVRALPAVDPHYAAAMRELDRELGEAAR